MYENEEGECEIFFMINNYINNIINKNCSYIMENKRNYFDIYNDMKLKKDKGIKKNKDYIKLIFKGEYKDGKKYKGKEYYSNGKLKFEGEYKDGNYYKGKIKKYNDYGELKFEGEYEDRKYYKGKEYNDYGRLEFEGEYKDGKNIKEKNMVCFI